MSQTKVKSGLISDQSITASKLDVTGNGNNGELLASNGDGSFTWTSGIATELYTDNAISNLIDGAPGALDTLNELAAALGDDANFAGTVTTALATKIDGGGTANYLSKWTDGDTIGNSSIFDNGTNVGIGTSSPTGKLDVAGVSGTWRIEPAGVRMSFDNAVGGYIRTAQAVPLVFETNGSNERMRIDAFGSVGIGTTPTYRFDVINGGAATANTVARFGTFGNGGSGRGAKILISASGSQNSVDVAEIVGYQNSVSLIADNAALGFNVANTSGTLTERMRIDSSGNVGIGTTNPNAGAKLDVNGNIFSSGISINTTSTSSKLYLQGDSIGSTNGDSVTHAVIRGARHHLEFKELRTANAVDWPGTTYKLQLKVDATEHQSIDFVSDINAQEHIDILTGNQLFNTRFTSDGKVGIGTSSPITRLDVLGPNASTGTIKWQNSGSRRAGYLYSDSGGVGIYDTALAEAGIYMMSNTRIDFRVNGSERMRIDSAGNVGIGTTAPADKLHINNGSIRFDNTNVASSGDYDFIEMGFNGSWSQNTEGIAGISVTDSGGVVGRYGITYAGGGGKFVVTDLYDYGFGASGDVFSVRGDGVGYIQGSLGIGTTSPNARLHLISTSSNPNSIRIENSEGYGQITTDNNVLTYDASQHLFFNKERTSEYMRITSSGNVGIGTTGPTTKLDIYGTSDTYLTIRNDGGAKKSGIRMYGGSAIISHIWQDDNDGATPGINFGTSADIATAPTVQLYVKGDDGNVGIGTTSPSAKLQIIGSNYSVANSGRAIGGIDLRATSNPENNGYGAGISFSGVGTGRSAISAVQNSSDSDNMGLAFFTHGSTSTDDSIERMRITSDGDLMLSTGGNFATKRVNSLAVTNGVAQTIFDLSSETNGMYIVSVVRRGGSVAAKWIGFVGVSAGSVIIYDILSVGFMTASTSGGLFLMTVGTTTTVSATIRPMSID